MIELSNELNILIILMAMVGLAIGIAKLLKLDFDIIIIGYLTAIILIYLSFVLVIPLVFGIGGYLLLIVLLYINVNGREVNEVI